MEKKLTLYRLLPHAEWIHESFKLDPIATAESIDKHELVYYMEQLNKKGMEGHDGKVRFVILETYEFQESEPDNSTIDKIKEASDFLSTITAK